MPLRDRDDIIIRFGGDDSRFQKAVKRVRDAGEGVRGHLRGVGDQIAGFFGARLSGSLAAVAAGLTALAKSALNTADAIAKTSDKVGVAVEDLQRLRYAASASGVEQNQLDTALQRFSRRVGEAANGTGELAADLERLNIPLRDHNGQMRSTVDILGDYADAVQKAESPQEKLRLAFKAFDSEGAALVNMLRNGKAGLREMMATADELGVVIEENLVRHSEALNQAWNDWVNSISVKAQRAFLTLERAIDNFLGNYRTLEDVQERLTTVRKELTEAEEKAESTHGRNRKGVSERIARLREEITELEKKRKELQAIRDLGKATRGPVASGGASAATPAGKKAKGTSDAAIPGTGYVQEKITLDESTAARAAALDRFRKGLINDNQLAAETARIDYLRGEITESEYRAKAEPKAAGAYGTLSNTASGAIAQTKLATQGPDFQNLNAQFQAWFAANQFTIKVKPELVGIEGVDLIAQDAADKTGGRD